MTGGVEVRTIVIVHGYPDPDVATALELANYRPVLDLGNLSLWALGAGPGLSPVPAGIPPGADDGPEQLMLTVAQAAAVLGVGRTTAYQLIADGELEVVHVGRLARVPAETLPDTVARLRRAGRVRAGRTSRPTGRIRPVGQPDASQPRAARTS
jgi:excisionase family DNA binding protein